MKFSFAASLLHLALAFAVMGISPAQRAVAAEKAVDIFPLASYKQGYERGMQRELRELREHRYKKKFWSEHWGSIKWHLQKDGSAKAAELLQFIDSRRKALGLPFYPAGEVQTTR